jgi:uncharacterized protein YndB with AHSA1/START domain
MTTTAHTTADTSATTTQVHRVYIKADAQRIWDAITRPEWTARYGYTGMADYDLRPNGPALVHPSPEFKAAAESSGFPCPDPIIDGEVLESDPPRRLVTTWRMLMDPTTAQEPFTRLTHEIRELPGGYCSLTVVHECEGAPATFRMVAGRDEDMGAGGGHAWVLSDLKTLLETGSTMTGGWRPGTPQE